MFHFVIKLLKANFEVLKNIKAKKLAFKNKKCLKIEFKKPRKRLYEIYRKYSLFYIELKRR